jgi:hypothetical protein
MNEQKPSVNEPARQDAPAKEEEMVLLRNIRFNTWQSIYLLFCIASAVSIIFTAASFDLLI